MNTAKSLMAISLLLDIILTNEISEGQKCLKCFPIYLCLISLNRGHINRTWCSSSIKCIPIFKQYLQNRTCLSIVNILPCSIANLWFTHLNLASAVRCFQYILIFNKFLFLMLIYIGCTCSIYGWWSCSTHMTNCAYNQSLNTDWPIRSQISNAKSCTLI